MTAGSPRDVGDLARVAATLVLNGVRAMSDAQRGELAELLVIKSRQSASIIAPPPIAYTTHTLAPALGITERAVREAIRRGDLAAEKRGRRWLIDPESVERFIRPGRDRASASAAARGRPRGHRPMAEALEDLSQQPVECATYNKWASGVGAPWPVAHGGVAP